MEKLKYDLILGLVKLLNLILITIPFGLCWSLYYAGNLALRESRKESILITFIFMLVYFAFGKVYDAFLISFSRISDMIFSQILALVMFNAIKRIVDEYDDVKVIYPIHMNPLVREKAKEIFCDNERIHIIDPLDVLDFHNFMARSYMILTDSGGIQEEAPSLGKPVLVMRDTTERLEGIEAGTLKLVGVKEEKIYREFKILLDDNEEYMKMAQSVNPYGDGLSCQRIANILDAIL